MIVGIHQLHYLPWLRYFHKIMNSDVFVVYDDVQFTKNDWQNRNRIKGANNDIILTVPIIQRHQQNLQEVEINNTIRWSDKHWKSLLTHYNQAKYFLEHKDFFCDIYAKDWQRLNDLNRELLLYLVDALGIKTEIVFSSNLNIKGNGTIRLINVCRAVGADTYLSGMHAVEEYLDVNQFEQEGIKLITQNWRCPQYEQLFMRQGFVKDLSIVDLLFNCGNRSLEILTGS